MQVKFEICVTKHWGMIRPWESGSSDRKIQFYARLGAFCFVYEEDQTGHILGYVEAEVYESLYSDAGLNVLGLGVFHLLKDVGSVANWWSELKNLPKAGIMLLSV